MKSEDVAAYLKNNPGFFAEHGDVLADVELDGVDPFHQRQVEALRKRHDAEKARYDLVVESARNNQALEQSLHGFACALLAAAEEESTVVADLLRERFAVDAARYCDVAEGELSADTLESLGQRVAHGSSICDDRVSTALLEQLFGEDSGIRSCAFVPVKLADGSTAPGILVLGSRDGERFQPGMGAIYLDRIGELVGARLGRRRGQSPS